MAKILLPDVPQVVKIVMKGMSQGQPFINTFHLKFGTPTDLSAQLGAVAAAAANAYWTSFGPSLNTGSTHVVTQAIDLTNRSAGFGADTTSHAGTLTGATFPPINCACCISFLINDRYRGGHPRLYLPAASIADYASGRTWQATAIQRYGANAASFRLACNQLTVASLTWQLVAVRYFSQGVLMTAPKVLPVTATAVHTRADSMRRRLGKEVA